MNNKNYVKKWYTVLCRFKYKDGTPTEWHRSFSKKIYELKSQAEETILNYKKMEYCSDMEFKVIELIEHPLTDTDQNQERKEVDYEGMLEDYDPKFTHNGCTGMYYKDQMIQYGQAAVTEYKRLNNITHE